MAVLPETFLSLMGRHFMAFTLFSAWHYRMVMGVCYRINELRALRTARFQESFRKLRLVLSFLYRSFILNPVLSISIMSVSMRAAMAGFVFFATFLARMK